MKQKAMLTMIILLFTAIFAGCVNKEVQTNVMMTFNLSGFPTPMEQDTSYNIVFSVVGRSGEIVQYRYENVKYDQQFTAKINVPSTAKKVKVYLTDISEVLKEPLYFWVCNLAGGETVYSTEYWLKYDMYFNYNRLVYGPSKLMVEKVILDQPVELDFTQKRYYIFDLTDFCTKTIQCDVSVAGGAIKKQELQELNEYGFLGSYALFLEQYSQIISVNYKYFVLTAEDESQVTKGTITFRSDSTFYLPEFLHRLQPGKTPDIVYGFNSESGGLYQINELNNSVAKLNTLPVLGSSGVHGMGFSPVDNKLYFVQYEKLIIWDAATNTYSEVKFTSDIGENAYSLQIAPVLRRIYISTDTKFHILNLDTYETIRTFAHGLSMPYLTIDEANKKLFVISGDGNYALRRYSVDIDEFVAEEIKENIGNYSRMFLSPLGERLILLSSNSFITNPTVKAIDPANFSTDLGKYFMGYFTHAICFNHDGSKLYGSGSDKLGSDIYVMDTNSYSRIKKIPIERNVQELASSDLITGNSDGSVIVLVTSSVYGAKLLIF